MPAPPISEANPKIGVAILCAGASSRMGSAKQLIRIEGKTLIRRAAEAACASRAVRTLVMLPPNANAMCEELRGLPIQIMENPNALSGIGTSIHCAVAHLAEAEPPLDAVILMLCDQPLVSQDTINGLIDKSLESGKPIVASGYNDTFGAPALFHRDYFQELLSLPNGSGARTVIALHLDNTAVMPCPAGAVDLDTPAEVHEFTRSHFINPNTACHPERSEGSLTSSPPHNTSRCP